MVFVRGGGVGLAKCKLNIEKMEERLIALVEKSPILYDPAHKKYTDSTLKTDVWDAIAKQLKLKNANTCKLKWNSLRDNYRKHLRKNRIRKAQGKKFSPYKYSEQFQFLLSYYESSHGDTNDSKEREIRVKQEVQSCDEESEEDGTREIKVEVEPPLCDRVIKCEVQLQEPDSMVFEGGEEPVSSTLWGAGGGGGREPHPVDAFLAGLAPMLKAMSPHHLSLAKAEMFSAAHRYEMRSLFSAAPHAPCCRCPPTSPPVPPMPPSLDRRRRSCSPEHEHKPFALVAPTQD